MAEINYHELKARANAIGLQTYASTGNTGTHYGLENIILGKVYYRGMSLRRLEAAIVKAERTIGN